LQSTQLQYDKWKEDRKNVSTNNKTTILCIKKLNVIRLLEI